MNYFQDFETKALNTISVNYSLRNPLVYRKFSRTTTIHPGIFGGRALSIRVFSADEHYLNNRVFLLRNCRLIVAPRKFDVLKTNICPRSKASRANMLVLRTSNFQGATIRPIVPRQTLCCLYCSPLNFLARTSSKIIFNYFPRTFFWIKAV